MRYFRPYIYESQFTLVTDHRPLEWLYKLKDANSRLARWQTELFEYEYDIVYKPGKVNSNADALSRNPPEYKEESPLPVRLADVRVLKFAYSDHVRLSTEQEMGDAVVNKYDQDIKELLGQIFLSGVSPEARGHSRAESITGLQYSWDTRCVKKLGILNIRREAVTSLVPECGDRDPLAFNA